MADSFPPGAPRPRPAAVCHPQVPLDARWVSLGLDRRYVARQTLALDVRLVAVSFAINALGKKRVRQLLARPRRA